ncbi:arginine/ornithine antiporter [Escherichia coli]|uniref:Arginine/ornithine antiporter n=1 Tax=Escherichia coli TaxID=562 RepID=A0A377BD81_ECOLX|nr:arginine/ornithine antiporter [Escherichia coli]
MLITLWVFIGVEGAVVVSARARNKRDVGKATLLAVLSALGVYLLVTLLSAGVWWHVLNWLKFVTRQWPV